MDNQINYSIIIPHKNIPELLQRCLDSIPRRQDVQIIVVDDNSDPEKVDFENFPGLNDSFVEVILTKEGRGAGYARNIGLKEASGKWLLFADADDYYIDGFLDYIDKYINSNYDLIYFGIIRIDSKTENKKIKNTKYFQLMQNAIYRQKYNDYKYTAYAPWGKIIRHSLIMENNILFDETIAANDKMFSLKTAYFAKNIHFDEYRIYIYEFGNNISSLTSVKTKESKFDRFTVNVRANVFLENISQKKYKTSLIPILRFFFDLKDMTYFKNALNIMKENNINILIELLKFCITYPFNKIYKIISKRYNIIKIKKKYGNYQTN